ncbi:MAG: hypothetical protein Q8M39_05240 [Sulfuricurvum sp.]|nr:hypothetical protein [Sulfuricurvum sp.]
MYYLTQIYIDPRIVGLMAHILLAIGYSLMAAVYFSGVATH